MRLSTIMSKNRRSQMIYNELGKNFSTKSIKNCSSKPSVSFMDLLAANVCFENEAANMTRQYWKKFKNRFSSVHLFMSLFILQKTIYVCLMAQNTKIT